MTFIRSAMRNGTDAAVQTAPNRPWYPSVDPFEHYDSGRTHRYEGATFGGSLEVGAQNRVRVQKVECFTPTPYNLVVRENNELFIYGGGYGDGEGAFGSLVAKLGGKNLSVQWWQQMSLTRGTHQWDYPGVVAVHQNGFVYVIYTNQLSKLDPETGEVLGTALLPALSAPENTGFNGFAALPDGTIIAKNVSRHSGCDEQGFMAFTSCQDASDVPPTMLVTIDPESLTIIDSLQGPEPSSGRISTTRYKGIDYVYLVGFEKIYRYIAVHGKLSMDETWKPVQYLRGDQSPASAIAVMNDYVVFNSNCVPTTGPLTVWAISQDDSDKQFRIQPFDHKHDQDSFFTAMVAVDPENDRIYAMNTGTSEIAALSLGPDGFSLDWMEQQTSFSFMSLVGSSERRVLVASDIPSIQGGHYKQPYATEQVVWREAESGRELARSRRLPKMNQGAVLSPGPGGAIYYPTADGQVIKLWVESF